MEYRTLVALAARAGVAEAVIDHMSVGKSVNRADAKTVLVLLSLHTDQIWSFDTIAVPLLAPPQAEEQQDAETTPHSLPISVGIVSKTPMANANHQEIV